MATLNLGTLLVTIEAKSGQYKAELQQAGAAAKTMQQQTGQATTTAGLNLQKLQSGLRTTATVVGIVTAGIGAAWQAIGQGAELELASSRFDRLTASIGASADALLGDLRQATSGMISDAQLMASASQIISLGLMDNETDVVRLARVVGEMGLDMQQVILTFANDSTMRLDALGLSIADVEERTRAYEEAGIDASKAFDLAVLDALEARLELIGSAAGTAAGDMKVLEADVENLKNRVLEFIAVNAAPALHALAGGFNEELQAMLGPQVAAAKNMEDLIALGQQLSGLPDAWLWFTGSANAAQEASDQIVRAIFAGSNSAEEFAANVQAAFQNDVFIESVGAHTRRVNELKLAYDKLEFERLTVLQSELTEENLRGEQATMRAKEAADELAASQALVADGVSARIYTERAGMEVTGASRLETERWTKAQEAAAAAARLAEEAAHALAVEYAGDFLSSLQAGEGATQNFNASLLGEVATLGAAPEVLGALALATGDFTEEQIEAALRTAAMNAAIAEMAPLVAEGTVSVETATRALQDMEEQAAAGYAVDFDVEDLIAAEEHAKRVKEALESIPTMRTVNVAVNFVSGGGYDPTLGTYVPPGAGGAQGGIVTGGIPGRDSVPAMLMPGEVVVPTSVTTSWPGGPEMFFRDLMEGGRGGNDGPEEPSNVYYISLVIDGRRSELPTTESDAEPFLAAARRLGVPV